MADINISEILSLREQSAEKVAELTAQIQHLEEKLVAFKERVKVYDELLNGSNLSIDRATDEVVENSSTTKKRAPRSTKIEMERRRKTIGEILFKQGDMQPKELLQEVSEKLGYQLESHHLRSAARIAATVYLLTHQHHTCFLPSPDLAHQHGVPCS